MCILMLPLSSGQLLHLHIVCAVPLLLDAVFALVLGLPLLLSPGVTQSQVALLIWCLKLHVSRSAWANESEVPVLEPRVESKGSVSVLLRELVAVNVFSGCFAASHEEEVIADQTNWEQNSQAAIDDHSQRNACVCSGVCICVGVGEVARGKIHCGERSLDSGRLKIPGVVSSKLSGAARKMKQRKDDEKHTHQTSFDDEREKVQIIAASNTIVEPAAVVIVCFYTAVAVPAMVGTKWAPYFTRIAEFPGHLQRACMLEALGIAGGWESILDHNPTGSWWPGHIRVEFLSWVRWMRVQVAW